MAQSAQARSHTILVVDDEPINIKLLSAYLKRAGHQVIDAQDGSEALAKARSNPDLILLDVMMPEMDGFETCRLLKSDENTRNIPVIFLSALSDTEIKARGLEIGGVDYVSKPFDSKELLARVGTHLTLRDQERQIRGYAKQLEDMVAERTKKLQDAEAEIKRDYDIQSVVNALLRVSLDDMELDELLRSSLKQILAVPLFSLDNRGAIFLEAEDSDEMQLVSYESLSEESVDQCINQGMLACPCGEALATRSITTVVEHMDDGSELHHICAPITHGEMLLGVIDIHLKEGHSPDDKEIEFLDAVANTLARVIVYKRAIRDLMTSEKHYRTIFESTGTAMAITDKDGAVLLANSEFQKVSGLAEFDCTKADFLGAIHPDDRQEAWRYIQRAASGKTNRSRTLEVRLHEESVAEQRYSTLVASYLADVDEYVLSLLDVTDRKRAEQQVLYNARHDALTGLPNRVLLLNKLGDAVLRAQEVEGHRFVVLVMDLDRFNIINESLGHTIGDRLLVAMAGRLKNQVGHRGLLCRLGGDEFAVLLPGVDDVSEGVRLAEEILNAVRQPFAFGDQELVTTSSIGIATSDIGYNRPEDVLRDADTALHRAKLRGKARYEVFDYEMHLKARKLMQLVTDMRQAIKREEFVLFYQPIVSLQTGRIVGVEALIRWQHPQHGLVSPGEFIPVAEESGLIIPIGQWALEESCRAMARFSERLGVDLMLSVNISGKQFAQEDLFDHVKQALVLSGMQPRNLKLEITESVVMENAQNAIALLERLKSLDLQVSIDDFGTGYSSLSYLHRFPVDMLKIDRSFVSMMDEGSENLEIARTIVALAHSLSLEVVAEGVENLEQQEMLRKLGCQYGQGFYYSRPLAESVLMEEGTLAKSWPMGQ